MHSATSRYLTMRKMLCRNTCTHNVNFSSHNFCIKVTFLSVSYINLSYLLRLALTPERFSLANTMTIRWIGDWAEAGRNGAVSPVHATFANVENGTVNGWRHGRPASHGYWDEDSAWVTTHLLCTCSNVQLALWGLANMLWSLLFVSVCSGGGGI